MSSSDAHIRFTRRAALVALAALAGCGFAPVYGPGGAGTALRDSIQFEVPASVEGYRLGRRLEDRLGTGSAYRLSVTIATEEDTVATAPDGVTTRLNLTGVADYTLIDSATGDTVASGRVNSFTGYSTTASTVAANTAADDARDRLMIQLADLIVTRLIAAAT